MVKSKYSIFFFNLRALKIVKKGYTYFVFFLAFHYLLQLLRMYDSNIKFTNLYCIQYLKAIKKLYCRSTNIMISRGIEGSCGEKGIGRKPAIILSLGGQDVMYFSFVESSLPYKNYVQVSLDIFISSILGCPNNCTQYLQLSPLNNSNCMPLRSLKSRLVLIRNYRIELFSPVTE